MPQHVPLGTADSHDEWCVMHLVQLFQTQVAELGTQHISSQIRTICYYAASDDRTVPFLADQTAS